MNQLIPNHLGLSLITKGVLLNGLITKGILSQGELIVITDKGRVIKKTGSGGSGFVEYDKDYWKRFKRDELEKDEKIEYIELRLERKLIKKDWEITATLIKKRISAELIKYELVDEDIGFDIRVSFISPTVSPKPKKPIIVVEQTEIKKEIKAQIKAHRINESKKY